MRRLPSQFALFATLFLTSALVTACGSAEDASDSAAGGAVAASGGAPAESPDEAAGGEAGAPDAPTDGAPTFHGEVKAILAERCAACHKPGGLGPFSVDTPEAVKGLEAALLASVDSGRMPPWPPSADCRHYEAERRVQPAELDVLRAWVGAGAPPGEPGAGAPAGDSSEGTAAEPLTESRVGPADFTGKAEIGYTPDRTLDDDYRCFILDPGLAEDRWVKSIDFRPDNETTVHHVLLFAISPQERESLEARDLEESGPGYTCFGGPGTQGGGALNTMGGWAPGAPAMVFPEDAGVRLPAGTVVVMQVHYNLLGFNGRPDQTSIDLAYHDERPAHDVMVNPVGNFALRIPAGDSDYTQEVVVPNTTRTGMTIYGVFPHMHTRGTRIRVEVEHADGESSCLSDIPHWDFHWQGTYAFREGEAVHVGPQDKIRLTCSYDNGGPNARLITWGESTRDEMCLAYLTIVRDVPLPERAAPPPAPVGEGTSCGGLAECLSACTDIGCEVQCQRAQSAGCQECFLTSSFACGTAFCPEETNAMTGCALGCMAAGDGIDTCPLTNCVREYLAYTQCVNPHRAEGQCNDTLERCGVEF